jgi:hypothetical protein
MAFKLAELVTALGALFVVIGLGGTVATALTLRRPVAAVAIREEEKALSTV